jgi:hypothetical protein
MDDYMGIDVCLFHDPADGTNYVYHCRTTEAAHE